MMYHYRYDSIKNSYIIIDGWGKEQQEYKDLQEALFALRILNGEKIESN